MNVKKQTGMSLIEATIILMILAILTAVLAPSMNDYILDARQVKAKEDTEALGIAIVRMLRDTGKPFLQITVGTSYVHTNRVDLIVSEGNIANGTTGTGIAIVTGAGNYLVDNGLTWDEPINATGVELATDHLVTNVTGYPGVTFPVGGGPKFGLGWRGGYLSNNTGPDPWGNRYGCTTVWLNPGSDATTTGKGTDKDVFCLTAGADGLIETDMDGNGTGVVVGGDDLIYVLQGDTR